MINKARKTYIYKKSVLFLARLSQGGRQYGNESS